MRNTIAEEEPWDLDEVLEKLGRPERCRDDKDKFEELLKTVTEDQWYPPLRRKFFELLDHRGGAERKRCLDVFLAEDYPSYGYAFLVLLAREGFFESFDDRLNQHNTKELWVSAIVIVSKDESVTKALDRNRERRLLAEYGQIDRFTLEQKKDWYVTAQRVRR